MCINNNFNNKYSNNMYYNILSNIFQVSDIDNNVFQRIFYYHIKLYSINELNCKR